MILPIRPLLITNAKSFSGWGRWFLALFPEFELVHSPWVCFFGFITQLFCWRSKYLHISGHVCYLTVSPSTAECRPNGDALYQAIDLGVSRVFCGGMSPTLRRLLDPRVLILIWRWVGTRDQLTTTTRDYWL